MIPKFATGSNINIIIIDNKSFTLWMWIIVNDVHICRDVFPHLARWRADFTRSGGQVVGIFRRLGGQVSLRLGQNNRNHGSGGQVAGTLLDWGGQVSSSSSWPPGYTAKNLCTSEGSTFTFFHIHIHIHILAVLFFGRARFPWWKKFIGEALGR